jgi:hypothetical protein
MLQHADPPLLLFLFGLQFLLKLFQMRLMTPPVILLTRSSSSNLLQQQQHQQQQQSNGERTATADS